MPKIYNHTYQPLQTAKIPQKQQLHTGKDIA